MRSLHWRELVAKVALSVLSLVLTLGAFELALRYVLLRNLNPFRADEQAQYRLKADFDGVYPRVPVRTDAWERRIPVATAESPAGRYLFVGDSVTFGYGVLAEESFPYQFGVLRGDVAGVANVGVPGYNLEQVLVILKEQIAHQKPEMIVYGMSVNDVVGAWRPLSFAEIDPHGSRSLGDGLLSKSLLAAFLERRVRRITERFDPEDQVNSPRAATLERIEDELDENTLAMFADQWAELEAIQRQTGVPFWVVVYPFRQQVEDEAASLSYQEYAGKLCESSPLRCLDPLPQLRARQPQPMFNGTGSYHFNPDGNLLLAEELDRAIQSPVPDSADGAAQER